MFTIKNAVKNIYRYKNKYVLFGILYLILILAASVCINIFVQMSKFTENILREYVSVMRLDIHGAAVREGRFTLEYLNEEADWIRLFEEEYLKIIEAVEHIDDIRFLRYNFSVNHLREDAAGLDIELHIDNDVILMDTNFNAPMIVFGYNMRLIHLAADDFDLESGRMFENDGEAVIGKNSKFIPHIWNENEGLIPTGVYESWNDLNLGDKIIIRNGNGICREFTIVGIQKEKPVYDEETNRRVLYTTLESAEYFDVVASKQKYTISLGPISKGERRYLLERDSAISTGYEALAYLSAPEEYLSLRGELENFLTLTPFFSDFYTLTHLTSEMYLYVLVFMILIAFIIVTVTIISTAILLNSRKYEIAVLRSVGMKKSKLIVNYLVENLAFIWGISVVSLIAAQFITPMFTGRTFEGIKELVSPEMFEQLTRGGNLGLILQNAGLVFAGTTAVVMLSLMLACVNIVRFEPLKIFNKQY